MQANAGSLLIVAAPLCWGVIAAKPPRIALLQLLEMRPLGDALLRGNLRHPPEPSSCGMS